MKTAKVSDYNNFNKSDPSDWARSVNTDLNSLFLLSNGRIRFGSNSTATNKGENIQGQFITYTTNGTPDTEDIIPHNLGSIPIGYLIVSKNKAGDIYQQASTGTTWNSSTISLKCSVASVTATLFLIQ